MPTILAASESSLLLDGKPVEGIRSIEYRQVQARSSVYALGSAERIGMTSGPIMVEGLMRVVSTSDALNKLTGDKGFQVSAQLKHGDTKMTVTFDECFLKEKSFTMEVGGEGEALYSFTAARVREEMG
jgi:hypothetical protein